MQEHAVQKKTLLDILSSNIIVDQRTRLPITPDTSGATWVFDFKQQLLDGKTLDITAALLWQAAKKFGTFQACGLETTAIALVAGVVLKAQQEGVHLNGFYIRKSRKKTDLQRMIEGTVHDDPIVLFDDILNDGKSKVRQIELLESIGKKVIAVVVVMQYRDTSYYRYLHEKGIEIISLCTTNDFPQIGGIRKLNKEQSSVASQLIIPFTIQWRFASSNPYLDLVIPKSAPALDDTKLYFGADNGAMWALNQADGTVAWKFQTVVSEKKKRIFSTPAVLKGVVYFGAYDGNFYALDARTGKKIWVYKEADWIGSSPTVAANLETVFIGLEFGLWNRQGGIAALDTTTGKQKWWQPIETLAHSSPAYSERLNTVVVGSSSGTIYAFNAKTGERKWTYATGGAVRAGFAIDETRELVCFGSEDAHIYALNVTTGAVVHKIETLESLYSTPLISDNRLFMGGLDKRIYCIDLTLGSVVWTKWTNGRIFASPALIDGNLFIGSNDGRLYELNPDTGDEIGFFQATERIVNKIAYNLKTKTFFVPTHANEIYCLKRKE